ncbi:MAG: radical SAM protein [Nanobdellota archaeon]
MRHSFRDIRFSDNGKSVRADFLRNFYFDIPRERLGEHVVKEGDLITDVDFDPILAEGMDDLKTRLTGNKAVYVHKNSDIPLIGSNSFGLTDRNTNLIEIKPVTGCNLNCIFCSVDEGTGTSKRVDFVVEEDYLIDGFRELYEHKGVKPLYAYINVHGEPLLYEPLVELIRDLKKFDGVITGIITNGTMLNKKLIDSLYEAGLDRINISMNAYSKELSEKLANSPMNVEKLKEMISYANERFEVVVAPLYLKGLNEEEMEEIISFVKSIKKNDFPIIGIQNFLRYRLGRNPVKQESWKRFGKKIKEWEEKYSIDLSGKEEFYNIRKTKALPKPFRKGQIVEAEMVCPDRFEGQALAKAQNRVITVHNKEYSPGSIRVKITREKHNIFTGNTL